MRYYEVYVASARHQKMEPLTYSSELKLKSGSVVTVPFGNKDALGVVTQAVDKPSFKTKPITNSIQNIVLPKQLMQLADWLQAYYPAGIGPTMQLFLPSSLLSGKAQEKPKTTKNKLSGGSLPPLTGQQQAALKLIEGSKSRHFLLHGETGSGKTRIYTERAAAALENGKSTLILTPEIALTPQLEADFTAQFGDKVFIIHSHLTPKKRREDWLEIAAASEPIVVIGPRSALFSPIANLGLVVVDEFHEPAYKQEQAPRYQAVRVAAALAKFHQAEIIYGSATPPVSEYYLAETTKTPIIRLSGLAKGEPAGKQQVKIELVSLADKSNFSRDPYLSDQLLQAIGQTLARKEQTLVYLNRRGTARIVLCQICSWQALCPNCDLPLTYHGDKHVLRCHTCGFTGAPPLSCPKCGSTDLMYRTIGTKALVEILQKSFPGAKIKRFDTDLGAADRMERQFQEVRSGNTDILVGTQMLGKGLDLPKLNLVGVIAADTSLYIPDYTAAERSYQLLHQVLGRVGRGHKLSSQPKVIIQTYVPDNPVLRSAIEKDYRTFYGYELIERKTFVFPPFCFLLKLSVSRRSPESAETAVRALHERLLKTRLKVRLSNPAPAYYEHTHGFYHWQLILKAKDRKELIKAIQALPAGNWTYDLDPVNLL